MRKSYSSTVATSEADTTMGAVGTATADLEREMARLADGAQITGVRTWVDEAGRQRLSLEVR
ncbi:hypothetical protein [Nitriliruptor alkaliphilus]|uniref:hypothetical protein n=1 Tax=Nitriliruptor alkaliphilus TaxID=427918 RepID=UPI0006980F2A|nr:hypothetical protein [Nitriliruptor alkaliphilus]